MSSLSSIQGSPIFTQRLIKPIDSYPYAEELQKACEEGNGVAIWDLVQRGANPNQPLQNTQKIARLRTRDYVVQSLDIDSWRREVLELLKKDSMASSLDGIEDKALRDEVVNLYARLKSGEPVSNEEIIDVTISLYVVIDWQIAQKENQNYLEKIFIPPLLIALTIHDFDLARGLVGAGADLQDPIFLERLGELYFNEQFDKVLDFLIEQGFNKEELTDLIESHQEFEAEIIAHHSASGEENV